MPTFVPGLEPGEMPGDDALVIATHELSVVLEQRDGGSTALPSHELLRPHVESRALFVGRLDGRPVWTAPVRLDAPGERPPSLPPPLSLVPARARVLFAHDESTVAAIGQAIALAEWDTTSRLCGRCGAPTRVSERERVRTCPTCAAAFRPRVAPAIIVLVEKDGEVLLARSPGFPKGMFGLVAGFVEPGETLEEAAKRETREEVGLEIDDLVYAGSQPWPIGRSLMIGFRARWTGGAVTPTDGEIEEAAFFSLDALPGLPPKVSIARKLVDQWIAERRGSR